MKVALELGSEKELEELWGAWQKSPRLPWIGVGRNMHVSGPADESSQGNE